jgi:hypothetical protein
MSAVLADDFMTGLKAGKTLRVLTSGQKKRGMALRWSRRDGLKSTAS